ncbi:MAG TPA: hypothetical protein VGS07_18755 [Thermoanaerobaculia bacterium]|jgi:hypothetical protein|nr:hypothetical protein [Thermoanaerobaculia bacterium]
MAQNPTILIGHGVFGRTLLRRLLTSTAARGALDWQDGPAGGDPAARRLKNLALLSLAGRGAGRAADSDGRAEEDRDLFSELESQIEEVAASPAALAAALEAAADRLLAAEDRAADAERLPLGLDVVVLSHPRVPEDVGELLNLLPLGMGRLAGRVTLERKAEGHERLNFLQILDFDQFWESSERGRRLRETVHKAVVHWEGQLENRRAGFGRTYLVDGQTQDGARDESYRIDEIILFLEFLLFEGQRDGDLQKLYGRQRGSEPTVGTFGVRLVERSAGLLSRLAAAAFGAGWLQHLAGAAGVDGDADLAELRRHLAPYRAAHLRELLATDDLRTRLEMGLRQVEASLSELNPNLADWPAQARERTRSAMLQLKNHLSRWAGQRVAQLDEELLTALPRELAAGVESALHRGGNPATLGRVIAELAGLVRETEDLSPPAPRETAAGEDPFDGLEAAHARYLEAKAEQIDAGRLPRWWGLLALVVAAAWTPLLLEALAEVPKPDPASHHLLRWGWQALQVFARPWLAGVVLFLAAFAAGRFAFQRTLDWRVRRALAFHTDPERGRLTDRIRAALAPGGGLRAQLDRFAERVERDLAARVRSDVQRETRRVLGLLRERGREALWLRDRLLDFLKGYGLDASLAGEGFERARRRRGGVRQSLERGEELKVLLQKNAPRPERFRSTQLKKQPFQGWAERYCGAFLHPLRFLDELSEEYPDSADTVLAGGPAAAVRAELLEFLARNGRFHPAFDWPQTEGVSVVLSHALVPASWSVVPEVTRLLHDYGWTDAKISRGGDPGRVYLLRVQLGVTPERLLARQSQAVLPEAV